VTVDFGAGKRYFMHTKKIVTEKAAAEERAKAKAEAEAKKANSEKVKALGWSIGDRCVSTFIPANASMVGTLRDPSYCWHRRQGEER
jgi:hypothetical protein